MTFTPPVAPARGTETLRTAPAAPPPFSILSVARDLATAPGTPLSPDGLPRMSVRRDHQRCVTATQLDNCRTPSSTPDVNAEGYTGIPNQAADSGFAFYPFSWSVPVGCEFTHPNYDRLAQVADEDVVAATAWNVSHQLWTGDANASTSTDSPSLATTATVLGGLTAGDVSPEAAVALLLQAFHGCSQAGGGAVLHVPYDVLPTLRAGDIVTAAGPQLVGPGGELVSAGPGYDGNDGPAGTSTADGESWIYVSGPIELRVGTTYDPANPQGAEGRPEGVANPRRNENSVILVRRAIFTFDTCCVFAVRVTAPADPD